MSDIVVTFNVACKYDNCLLRKIGKSLQGNIRFKCINCLKLITANELVKPKLKLNASKVETKSNSKEQIKLKFK